MGHRGEVRLGHQRRCRPSDRWEAARWPSAAAPKPRNPARRLGITYEVLDNHDGELLPTLAVREQIIRRIRQWNADIVLAPRPNDYHPGPSLYGRARGGRRLHGGGSQRLPGYAAVAQAIRYSSTMKTISRSHHRSVRMWPSRIDDVFDLKVAALDAHVSQVYEWLPWVDGTLDTVPKDPAERKRWLAQAARARSRRRCAARWRNGTARSAPRTSRTRKPSNFANTAASPVTKTCADFSHVGPLMLLRVSRRRRRECFH